LRGLCLGDALALGVLLGGVADGQPWREHVSAWSVVVLCAAVLSAIAAPYAVHALLPAPSAKP